MGAFPELINPVGYERANMTIDNSAVFKLSDLFTPEFRNNASYWMIRWIVNDANPVVLRYSKVGLVNPGEGMPAVVRRMPSSTTWYGYLQIENKAIYDACYVRGDTNTAIQLHAQSFQAQGDARIIVL